MTKELENILIEYNIKPTIVKELSLGAGGNSYLINNKCVLKACIPDQMNHPKEEPLICEILLDNNIKTLRYIKNNKNEYSFKYNDYIINVYEYIEGYMPSYNSLDDNIVDKAINILANINKHLENIDMPLGLSQGFFDFMTPDKVLLSYNKSLKKAYELDDKDIIKYIKLRIELLEYIKNWSFDISKLTCLNSHGDFTTNQLIINDDINIIDFTCACRQPVIWEITRFFFHADKSAINGKLDINRFNEYLNSYQEVIKLNDYDLENIFKLYFYQILVCDYYSQYFNELDEIKKADYLNQANFASNILKNNKELIINNLIR